MSESFSSRRQEVEKLPLFLDREELRHLIQECTEEEDETKHGEKLLEKLLQEKERFTSVFQTEKESYYFTLHDGTCLRMKKSEDEFMQKMYGSWKIFPPAEHVLFVDSSSVDTLKLIQEFPGHALLKNSKISSTIAITDLRVGAVPFEYGFIMSKFKTKPVFRIDGTSAMYVGSEENGNIVPVNRNGLNYYMGISHIGHAISKVLWYRK